MPKPNMGELLKQAQKIQEQMQKVQEGLANLRADGSAGGGMVTVVANGKNEILEVHIDPEVVDPDDVEMLEDLVAAAVNQALQNVQELVNQEMGKMTGGLLPGGLKIPGLT
jgi:DNA-binding YbaB/EbfC family protein